MKNIVKIIGFAAGVILLIWGLSGIFNGAKWVGKILTCFMNRRKT